MTEEWTNPEVVRALTGLQDVVAKLIERFDELGRHYVSRELWDVEMDPKRDGSLMSRAKTLEGDVAELKRDTFSKKQMAALLTLLAAVAVGASAMIGALHP